MNTCKTCKLWKPVETSKHSPLRNTGGYCRSENLLENWAGDEDHQPVNLVYSYSEGGSFWTGPDFGCAHHSEGQP